MKEFDPNHYRNGSEWKQTWLHLLCKPNLKNLSFALQVEAAPQYESCLDKIDNDQEEESKEGQLVAENSESLLTRDSLIKSVNDAFEKLSKDKKTFE